MPRRSASRVTTAMFHASSRSVIAQRSLFLAFAVISLTSLGMNACSKDEVGDASDDSGSGGSAGAGISGADTSKLYGSFNVSLVEPVPANGDTPETPGFTSILGKVFDGPTPEGTIWEVSAEKGACRLLEPRVPFCDPACGTAVCVEDGQCQDRPSALNLGTAQVSGVKTDAGDTEFSMNPIVNTY